MPARTISAMYAASFNPSARIAARNGVMKALADPETNSGPNGIPKDSLGNNAEMLNQNMICTKTGVPRKNQMYNDAAEVTNGFGDSRITARMMPSTIPMVIAMTVKMKVLRSPARIRGEVKYSPITSHSNRGLVRKVFTSIAARTKITRPASQRPTCRLGMACIASGRLPAGPVSLLSDWVAPIMTLH